MRRSFTPMWHLLWVEDGTHSEVREEMGALNYDWRFQTKLAEDTSQAMEYLKSEIFSAVIVDNRLPPGRNPAWQALYQLGGGNRGTAALGLHLVDWMLNPVSELRRNMECMPRDTILSRHVGIYTVDSQHRFANTLTTLGITEFQRKTTATPDTIVVQMALRLVGAEELPQ